MEKKENFFTRYGLILITGVAVGLAALGLTAWGNPSNMGFCIACFLRDIAGALGLHAAAKVQYVRPEIIGLVLGSTIIALIRKEFRPQGGSSPFTRFLIAIFVMIGALVFLGCPLRMIIRLGGGDLNALVGLVGFIVGILIGAGALRMGFSFRRAYKQSLTEGLLFPIVMLVLLLISLTTTLFNASAEGPCSQHAPWLASLVIALAIGALCQQSRLCMVGGVRDAVMFKDFKLILGFVAILITVVVGNLILGKFKLSFEGQPIAHTDGVWNFLGMLMVGWGSVLLGGCPLRQLILAGEGNSDSAVVITGFIVGAALSHNFGLASSGDGIGAGPVVITMIVGFVFLLAVSLLNISKKEA